MASVPCTAPAVALSEAPIAGSAGRYMSMENGPIAAIAPRMSASLR